MRLPVLLLALLACVGAAPPNWTRTVTMSGGAAVIGNPKAPVRVVEYTSYTCPHCAAFVREGQPRLMADVARGTVAFEVRNAVRDRLDFVLAVAARCAGASRFLGNHEAIFAAQTPLVNQAVAGQEGAGKNAPTEANAALKALAHGSGLSALMAKRGLAPAALDACLTNKAMQAPVLAMTEDAWTVRKLPGTPAFLVDGELVSASGYDTLAPFIQARLGGGAKQGR